MLRALVLVAVLLIAAPRASAEESWVQALVALAGSSTKADHAALLSKLKDPKTQARLTALQQKLDRPRKCGLGAPPYRPFEKACGGKSTNKITLPWNAILCALVANQAASARGVLLDFAAPRGQDDDLLDRVLEASTGIRPPPPALVKLWDKAFAPGSGSSNIVPDVLLDNESDAALDLLLRKARDRRFDESDHQTWALAVYVRRQSAPVLRMVRRMLEQRPSASLQVALVGAVFTELENRSGYVPPKWKETSAATRAELRRVATSARKLKLSPSLRRAVEATLAGLSTD